MYEYENRLHAEGIRYVCGIDEAGRGPLAGPVYAGAVILDPDKPIPGLRDSKQLSARQREKLARSIKENAIAWAVAGIDADEIDRINIYQATKKAMIRAVEKCGIKPEYLLIDAMKLTEAGIPYLAIIKGDQLSASIAAASILAKTERDEYMDYMDRVYPGYGFERHKGYPTAMHKAALEKLGPSPIHRLSFKPVKALKSRQMSMVLECKEDE